MRLPLALVASALLLMLAPTVSAAQELPVGVRVYHDETLPGNPGCGTCLDVWVQVGFGMTGCCDLPFFGVGADVSADEGLRNGEVRVYACYTAFVGICFVDQTVPLPT